MLVGVNALMVEPGHAGGTERYLRHVLAKMREVQPDTQYVLFTDPGNHESFVGWDRACLEGSGRTGLLNGETAQLDRGIKARNVDLLFSPLATAPISVSVPQVLFTLDVRNWDTDYALPRGRSVPKPKVVKRLCANAAAIVVPSEFVQRLLLKLFDIPLDRAVLAPFGIDPVFDVPQPVMVEQPYLLMVGDTREFKNIPRALEVFKQLQEKIPHQLVVVGRPAEAEPEEWGPRVARIEHCPTPHLAGLYQHCDVYIQPSLYEGSGITALEAMRAATLVTAGRTGAIGEMAGVTPLYFNPESVTSMVSTIRRALDESPEQRQDRIKFGKYVASEYTWEKCAWKVLGAFKKA